jgi:hypothetical protein
MQPYFDPTRKMTSNKNGRRSSKKKRKEKKMTSNKSKWKTTSIFFEKLG